jgi:hypothetical protein
LLEPALLISYPGFQKQTHLGAQSKR